MFLHDAASNGDLTAAESALSSPNGRACINKLDKHGRTPLHWAARNGHEGIVDLLIRKGADVNIQTKSHKYTALIMAVEFGHQAIVKKLVGNKANVNLAADGNNTALHKAALSKDNRLLQILLENGAYPTPVDSKGRTPLGRAVSEENAILLMGFGGRIADGETQDLPRRLSRGLDLQDPRVRIHWVVRAAGNPIPIVERLLAADPQLITSTNPRGWHLLHSAAFVGNRNLVELLLNADSGSINCLTRGGWTPLLLAAEKGHNDVLQLLIKNKADTTIIPTERNKERSAVWYAKKAKACTAKTVEMLENLAQSQERYGNPAFDQDREDDGCTTGFDSASHSEVGGLGGHLYSKSSSSSGYDFFGVLEKTLQNHLQFREGDKIVKVAVLDSGINLNHPDFKEARVTRFGNEKLTRARGERAQLDRINANGLRNFVAGTQGKDDVRDLDGHGTKVAGLILRLAPRAELYIARVCDGRELSGDSEENGHQKGPLAETVAAAVEWAIDQKVDIINMSFGFDTEEEVQLLSPALRRAKRNDILVFAAMSNGGPMPAVWPAKDDYYAIGIHSYSTKSNARSHFTAEDVDKNQNLMVPGEGVMTHTLRGPNFEPSDGTSYATPVAAAMAALILAFVNEKRCAKEREEAEEWGALQELSKTGGMARLLGSLRGPRDGSPYILIPATLFWKRSSKQGTDDEDKRIAWDIIKRVLKS